MLKKVISNFKKEILIYGALLLLSVLASFSLLKPGYFSMHDDVQVMRLYELEKCFQDGQFPCRLVPDMGAGYGHLLYNFHPVLPYYTGEAFRLLGFSFIDVSKILFFLAFLGSGFFMFLLSREFFGKAGGLTAAAFFLLAPYHSVDIYVRGALTESWAIVFFPLIFWGIYKLIKTDNLTPFLVTIFALTGLFLSHNIMSLIFPPFAFLWAVSLIVLNKKWRKFIWVGVAFVWSFGLSSLFLIPAFLEKSFVKIETMTTGYYDFHIHFATIKQLFIDRNWGYGPSIPGPNDTLSFQLGWPHWWFGIASIALVVYMFLRSSKEREKLFVITFFVITFIFSIFMTHSKSVFIWDKITLLSFVQFPWRFLGVAMFANGVLAAGLISFLKSPKKQWLFAVASIILVVTFNISYFRPEKSFPSMNDGEKLSGEEWRIQSMATLMDYVPKKVINPPTKIAPVNPWLIDGEAKLTEFRKRSDFWRFTIETLGTRPAVVEVPVFDYPKWQVLIDQQEVSHDFNPQTGVVRVDVPPGKHTVVGWFKDTPVRKAANMISLASLAFLILFIVWKEQESGKNRQTA